MLFVHRKYNPAFYFFPVELFLKQGLYLRLFFQGNECCKIHCTLVDPDYPSRLKPLKLEACPPEAAPQATRA